MACWDQSKNGTIGAGMGRREKIMYSEGKSQVTTESTSHAEQENKARLELIYEVSKKVGSVPRMAQLLEKIIKMTQQTLKASASSVLLYGDNERELFFEVASGPVGKSLRRVKVSTQSGVAGWVARTGKPLIVNDVNRDQHFDRIVDEITGFVTRSIICVPLIVHRKTMGVIEVINKLDGSDFNEQDLEAVVSVAATAAMAIENTKLHQNILEAYKSTIITLAAAIDAKDPYTRGHSQRVMEYALLGGAALSLPAEEMETLEYASILHDIGKISIDARILNKPDSLTPSEWNIMREHSVIGANLLKEIPFLEKASELVLHHHERYDGEGYPAGIKGEDIPLGARLIAVADAFDTMTTDRSYRPALTVDYSISELYGCSGTQFCPKAVEAFVSGLREHAGKNSGSSLGNLGNQ
jgi:putative nucleotidyltransferase with HDIG domain